METIKNADYWRDGKAEVAVYELSQNRYQELHKGTALMVFVPEEFMVEKQVKKEGYGSGKSTAILKNIRTRKFATGIYDYSLFTSVFTPTNRNEFPNSLKVSTNSQEWCGTIFSQLNLGKDTYRFQKFSYFEAEGDLKKELKIAVLEDELFSLIRLNPRLLPKGHFPIIPNLEYLQLTHKSTEIYEANGRLKTYKGSDFKGDYLKVYSIEVKELSKTLNIVFKETYPHEILGYTESYPSAFDGKIRTTIAQLKVQKKIAYWNNNSLKDLDLRKELGLR